MIASIACPRCQSENIGSQPYCQKCGFGLLQTDSVADLRTSSQILVQDRIGKTINEKYKVLALLGEGGFGTVYKVEQVLMGQNRIFALKILHPSLSENAHFRSRFIREASIAMELVHPNAIPVRDFGLTEDGQLYFSMDYCRGESLKEAISREGFLSLNRSIEAIRQILDVLEVAHDKQIIHRDLKPENIFLDRTEGGREMVKVGDFGLARNIGGGGGDGDDSDLTQGGIVGTPRYMSPEQAKGQPLDARSDLYSVGVMFFEMISGELPPRIDSKGSGSSLSAQMRLREHLPESIVVPSAVLDVMVRALAPKPADRFRNASEFLESLETLPTYTPTYVGVGREVANSPRKMGKIVFVLLLLVVIVSGVAIVKPASRQWIITQLGALSGLLQEIDGKGQPDNQVRGKLRDWVPFRAGDKLDYRIQIFEGRNVQARIDHYQLLSDPNGLLLSGALTDYWWQVSDKVFAMDRFPKRNQAKEVLRWQGDRPLTQWKDGHFEYQLDRELHSLSMGRRTLEDCFTVTARGIRGNFQGEVHQYTFKRGYGLVRHRRSKEGRLLYQSDRMMDRWQ